MYGWCALTIKNEWCFVFQGGFEDAVNQWAWTQIIPGCEFKSLVHHKKNVSILSYISLIENNYKHCIWYYTIWILTINIRKHNSVMQNAISFKINLLNAFLMRSSRHKLLTRVRRRRKNHYVECIRNTVITSQTNLCDPLVFFKFNQREQTAFVVPSPLRGSEREGCNGRWLTPEVKNQ